jgi:cytochrome c-type biogenesis protein CcmE
MAKEKDDRWIMWLAIVLSVIGTAAIVMMALKVLGVI